MASRGQRRDVFTIQNPGVLVPDGSGGYTETPVVLAQTIFGALLPASSVERQMPGVVTASASHLVTIDYLAGVTLTSTLILHDALEGDRTFAITNIADPENRHRELVLTCEEAQ